MGFCSRFDGFIVINHELCVTASIEPIEGNVILTHLHPLSMRSLCLFKLSYMSSQLIQVMDYYGTFKSQVPLTIVGERFRL